MKKLTRFCRLLLCLLCAALCFAGCGNNKSILKSSKEERLAVMNINGIDVPLEMYRYVIMNSKADIEAEHGSADIWLGEEGEELLDELNDSVKITLKKLYATVAMCAEYGINANDEYFTDTLDAKMDDIYKTYGGDYKAYISDLDLYYMNDSVYRFLVRDEILSEELLNKLIEKGEIQNERETLEAEICGNGVIRVKQILVTTGEDRSEEDAQKLAQTILDMLNDGGDFDALVKKYGQDLMMFNNPDGYYFSRGTYNEEFESAAFALEIGETSEVVKTDAGYSIIKRYEKEDGYLKKNFDILMEKFISGRYSLAVEEFMAKMTVTEYDAIAKYSAFNLNSIK